MRSISERGEVSKLPYVVLREDPDRGSGPVPSEIGLRLIGSEIDINAATSTSRWEVSKLPDELPKIAMCSSRDCGSSGALDD